jgi:hypothetical protein
LYMWWGVPALIAAWRCETGCASYVTEFLTDSVPTGVAVEAAITGLRYNELCTNRQARLVLFLMAPEGETAIPYLIDALYYGDGKTGITRTLGKYGPAALSAVPHLAFILHDESAGSDLKQHAHESLTAITGEDFGQDADAWVEWWKKQ